MKGLAYYETVAQIIPVLVLVVVVEYRILERRVWEGRHAALRSGVTFFVMLTVISAELSALAVLKEEEERAASYWVTLLAVFLLFLVIIFNAETKRRRVTSSSI